MSAYVRTAFLGFSRSVGRFRSITRERIDLPPSNMVHTYILGGRENLFILGDWVKGQGPAVKCILSAVIVL